MTEDDKEYQKCAKSKLDYEVWINIRWKKMIYESYGTN